MLRGLGGEGAGWGEGTLVSCANAQGSRKGWPKAFLTFNSHPSLTQTFSLFFCHFIGSSFEIAPPSPLSQVSVCIVPACLAAAAQRPQTAQPPHCTLHTAHCTMRAIPSSPLHGHPCFALLVSSQCALLDLFSSCQLVYCSLVRLRLHEGLELPIWFTSLFRV